MKIEEEKKQIYSLMKEIIQERRELNKVYYELKFRLDQLDSINVSNQSDLASPQNIEVKHVKSIIAGNNRQQRRLHDFGQKKKSKKNYPFERIAGYIIEMLKEEGTSLNSKKIFDKLQTKYDVYIGYTNLTNNILRKMIELDTFSIEKVGRGLYQYQKKGRE